MKRFLHFISGMETKKVILLLLFVVLVPLLLIQALTYYRWFQDRKDAEMQTNLEVARTFANTFEAFVYDVLHTELAIGMVATSPARSDDEIRNLLRRASGDTPSIRSITWINPQGRLLMSGNRGLTGSDLSGTDYIQAIQSGQEMSVSNLFVSQTTGQPIFTVCRGIRDSKGNLLGIVGAAIDPESLKDVLAVSRAKGAGVSLLDRKGMHVFRWPKTEYTWEQRNWLKHVPSVAEALAGKEFTSIEKSVSTGKNRIVGWSPVSKIGWVATASRAEEDVVAPILSAMIPQIILLLITVLSTVFAALALSRPMVTSIRNLRDRALALGRGQREAIEITSGPSEMKDLSKAFTQMVDEVRLREGALRESEERYRGVVQNTTAVILRLDPQGIIQFANERALQFFGYSAEELIGMHAVGTIVPERESTGRDLTAMVDAIAETPDRYHSNTNENMRKNGERVWMEWTNSSIYDADGQLKEFLSVGIDATARKRAEEAAAAAHMQVQSIIDNTPDIVYAFNLENRFIMANKAVAEVLNSTPEQLIGKRRHEFMSREDADWHEANERRVIEAGKALEFEEYSQLDGRSITWLTKKFPLRHAQGKIYAVAGISADITERKQAEERLRQSESRFREMAETVPSIIFTALPDGSIDYFNERALNYAGLPAEEVMGEGWLKVVHPQDVDRSIRAVAESLRTGQPYELMQRLRGADGSYRWFMARARAILDEKGAVLRWFGSATDIHDMIVAGKALQESEARFRLLSETAARLLVSEDPQVLVNDLCRDVMEHLDCQAFFNFMVDERAGRLRLNACAGISEEEVRKLEWLDYGVAVCGCVARDNARIIAEDIFHTPDVRTELVRSYGIQAYCCHPLKAQDRLIGTLSFGTKTRARFTAEEVDLMRIVADQVAVAMQRVQARQELRASEEALRNANEQLEQRVRERTTELVLLLDDLEKSRDDLRKLASELVMTEERERKRIAGVLHDDIAQLLASARMQLSLLQGIPSDQNETLEAAKAFLLQSLRETRGLMHDLGNPVLFEMGLQAACEAFANSLMERHPVRIRCDIREAYKHLNPDVKTILYQLIRELLNNVVKHSKARNAHVIVEMENGHFRVRVTDDGVGFDPQASGTPTVEGGFGLYSIRERLIALSGSLSIESSPGAGTVVTAVLPAALG